MVGMPPQWLVSFVVLLFITLSVCIWICKHFCNGRSGFGQSSGVKVSNVTPISLLEVKVAFPVKVIYGNPLASKRYDPTEMAQIPKVRLGEGMLGTLFKVVLDDGCTVTMRKIREGLAKPAELESWICFFGQVQDPWLLPIEFSFWYGEEAFILYEYLCLGSLEELLHGREGIQFTSLTCEDRLKIALCTAKAVASIHNRVTKTGEPLVCGVIKSSNVMIKDDFSACLSGYETPYLVATSTMIRRNSGRVAPELKSHNAAQVFTQKTDVYSFGILLLELITEKKPALTDLPRRLAETDLEKIKFTCTSKDIIIEMIRIAQRSISYDPDERPSMERVVQMIAALMH